VANYDLALGGPFTCRDSSQSPALVLDLDPISLVSTGFYIQWNDTSGQSNDGELYNYTYSSDNGYTIILNSTSTYATVPTLTTSSYSTVSISAWIKPDAVNVTQTVISKEICYKMIITGDGRIAWMVGDASGNSWTTTIYAAAGLVTTSTWSHVAATVNSSTTKIYINGVLASTGGGATLIANNYRFAIGAYDAGQSGFSDYFGGRMGEVKVWNYALTEAAVISQYNSTAARYGATVIPQSLDFTGSGNPWLLVSNTQSDWNLGSTSTIEFWSKTVSTSSIRTVASQGPSTGIDIGFFNGHILYRNQEIQYSEPTTSTWAHVAFVSTGTGLTNLYYNGVYQTNFSGGALNDGSTDLAIGRRGPTNSFQYYKGKLAMLRISNTAKYSTTFAPSYSYGVEADTQLLLGNDPLTDSTTVHPIDNQGVVASTDFPSYQSLVFNQPEGDYLSTPASSDWNLGNNWTMEFWINANNSSNSGIHIPGGQWGLIDQGGWYGGRPNNSILIGLVGGILTIAQSTGVDIQFAEPTPGVWTHVAVVNNGGGTEQKVYYNGVEQTKTSGTYQSNGWTNVDAPLFIGRLSNFYGGYSSEFDGKMAMIRISNATKYLTAFTATTTYGVESDTVLFLGKLNPVVDAKAHDITNNGTTLSNSFPLI
jgi:hypothetical protein